MQGDPAYYLVIAIHNSSKMAAWGTLRVRVWDGDDWHPVYIPFLRPNVDEEYVVLPLGGVIHASPTFEWIALKGK